MEKVLQMPELQALIQRELSRLLLQYGVILVVILILFSFIAWNWINKKVSGEVEKGITVHKEKIANSYAVQLEIFRQYVVKYHEAYAELNRLLLKAQASITVQFFKTYPDFKDFSLDELTKYLEEKKAIELDVKRLTALVGNPKILQSEMQDYIKRFNLWKGRDLMGKVKNHYWRNALYFSNAVGKLFDEIWKDMNELLLLQEYPSGVAGCLSKQERDEALSKQKNIDNKIDKLINLMKREVSAGYIQ